MRILLAEDERITRLTLTRQLESWRHAVTAVEDGQEAWVKTPRNSRRTDVTPAFPDMTPKKGREYFVGQAEKLTAERIRLQQIAKQTIDGVAPRSDK